VFSRALRRSTLADLVLYRLRAVRSYLLKENFQFFRKYGSLHWAGQFMDRGVAGRCSLEIAPLIGFV